jgi:hypothetical protein
VLKAPVFSALAVAAQVNLETKIRKRFIMLYIQALKSSAVNPALIWGQPAPP